MKRLPASAGFTLVEMVVALLIFALLASAGVGLLRASVDTQQAVEKALADLGATARLRVLLSSDLSQAVSRPLDGAPRGFVGSASEFKLVRLFEPAEQVRGASGLQAVRWRIDGDRLVRQSIAPGGEALGVPSVLARNVATFALRYRAADGGWRTGWDALPSEAPMPRAVELRLQQRDRAAVTILVALPEGPAPPKPAA